MDWERLKKLMLPIRLRHGRRLMRLLGGLAGQTETDAELARAYQESELEEARKVGQVLVVEQTLKAKYGEAVRLRGQEDGRVVLFGNQMADGDYRKICVGGGSLPGKAVLITDVAGTDVGCDVVVEVPEGTDEAAVRKTLDGLLLCGVGYRIVTENQN